MTKAWIKKSGVLCVNRQHWPVDVYCPRHLGKRYCQHDCAAFGEPSTAKNDDGEKYGVMVMCEDLGVLQFDQIIDVRCSPVIVYGKPPDDGMKIVPIQAGDSEEGETA